MMSEKELYRQKLQAQLDEWKAEHAILKARASGADADARLAIINQTSSIEPKLEEAQGKLSELAEASENAWYTVKSEIESVWDSLKFAFRAPQHGGTKNGQGEK